MPDSDTTWGLLYALVVMVMVPVRTPVAVGLNVNEIVQKLPAPSPEPQLLPVVAKSPVTPMPVNAIGPVPTLVSEIPAV